MFILITLVQGFSSSVGGVITLEGSRSAAAALRTLLAVCKVRLFKGPFSANPASTKVAMVADEAGYDGYTLGGNTITAWGAPLDNPNGGTAIAGETTFAYADGMTHVGNTISGGWVEDAAGEVIFAFNLPNPVDLTVNGQGFVLQLQSVSGYTG